MFLGDHKRQIAPDGLKRLIRAKNGDDRVAAGGVRRVVQHAPLKRVQQVRGSGLTVHIRGLVADDGGRWAAGRGRRGRSQRANLQRVPSSTSTGAARESPPRPSHRAARRATWWGKVRPLARRGGGQRRCRRDRRRAPGARSAARSRSPALTRPHRDAWYENRRHTWRDDGDGRGHGGRGGRGLALLASARLARQFGGARALRVGLGAYLGRAGHETGCAGVGTREMEVPGTFVLAS